LEIIVTITTFQELINNTALLLILVILYDLFPRRRPAWLTRNEVFSGLLIGSIGLIVMLNPLRLVNGVIFDTRSILLSMSGLFFGLVPTAIAVGMTATLRIITGGGGTVMGVAVILTSAGLGLAWRYYLLARNRSARSFEYYAFGVVVHAVMLLCTFLLPIGIRSGVLRDIYLPVLLVYPVGTLLMGSLLKRHVERIQGQTRLDLSLQMLNKANDMFYVIDPHTARILDVNDTSCERLGYTHQEFKQLTVGDLNPFFPMQTWPEHVRQAKDDGPILLETRHRGKDGGIIPVEVNVRYVVIDQQAYMLSNVRDISERRLADANRAISEARYKSLVETQTDVIARSDPEGRLTFVNDAYCQAFGQQREDLIGSLFFPTVIPEDQHIMEKLLAALRKPPYKNISLSRHPTPLGVRWFEWSSAALLDEQGNISELQGIGRDVTERKQAEDKILKGQERQEHVQEMAQLGGWEIDLAARRVTASAEAQRIYGLQGEVLTLDLVQASVLPEYRPKLDAALGALINEGQEYNLQFKIRRKSDGEVRDIHSRAEYRAAENSVVGSIQDITERMLILQVVMESEEKFRTLFERAHDAILMENEEDGIMDANARACEMFGYTREELLGMKIPDLQAPEVRGQAGQVLQSEITKFGSNIFESRNLRKDGSTFPVEISSARVSLPKGFQYVSIIRDITERKRIEQELREQIDILERMNDVTVGRELKMLELKKEINLLLVKAGQPEKYRIIDA
jgi:PAS domain S-box-containing protein